ncbi:MAG: hypothetical protein ACTHMV_07295 [Chitinophagaceae bacterium]
MNKYCQYITLLAVAVIILMGCGAKKETAETIAAKWCSLNADVTKAAEGEAQQKARQARSDFENAMETKYKEDTAMMRAIFKAVEACEGASEGRNDKVVAATATTDLDAVLPLAYANAKDAADAYCSLIDQSISAAQSSNDTELKKIVSAKMIFEKNMDESYKDNPERRDSIFRLIQPCMAREVKFRQQ